MVSAGAGVAEIYPPHLHELLLPDPENLDDLVNRLWTWRSNLDHWRCQVTEFSRVLRAYSWRDMAERFYELVNVYRQAA
jgi:hypothetical protein